MSGADMFGQRHTGFAVMFADEAALMTQAQTHIARVANDDALQAKQFVEVDGLAPRLADGPAPALNAILRRMLAFDGEARFGNPSAAGMQQSARAGRGARSPLRRAPVRPDRAR